MSDGETKIEPPKAECPITKVGMDGVAVESMVPHCWRWVWNNGQMTNQVQCSTCNKIENRPSEQT